MKRTAKYNAGFRTAKGQGLRIREGIENETLYQKLESEGFWWDSSSGSWSNEKRSTSMFADADGDATGVIRLRVMGHLDDIDDAVAFIKQTTGIQIFEQSDLYANRRGQGFRVYLSGVLNEYS